METKNNLKNIELSTEREAYSISEWCRLVGISRAFFYRLSREDRPTVVKLGRRSLITRTGALEWQQRMEGRTQ